MGTTTTDYKQYFKEFIKLQPNCVFCGCDCGENYEMAHYKRQKNGVTPSRCARRQYRSHYDKQRFFLSSFQACYILCGPCHRQYDRGNLKGETRFPRKYRHLHLDLFGNSYIIGETPASLTVFPKPMPNGSEFIEVCTPLY